MTMRMTTDTSASRTGAALVVALGVLSLVLLLATAFVLSLQTERLAIRGTTEKSDARAYADIAPVIAAAYLEPEIDQSENYLTPHAYWRADEESSAAEEEPPGSTSASKPLQRVYEGRTLRELPAEIQGLLVGSDGTEIEGHEMHVGGADAPFTDFPPVATNYLPPSLTYQLSTNELPVRWQFIQSVNQNNTNDLRLTGRVAFLVADLSGLADIRHATTNQLELALGDLEGAGAPPPAIIHAATTLDLAALLSGGSGVKPPSLSPLDIFTTHSLDPDPWCLPRAAEGWDGAMFLGNPAAPPVLTNKFDLASLTNSAAGRERILGDCPEYPTDGPRAWWRAEFLDDDLRDALSTVSNALFHTEPRFGHDTSASNRTARALFWNLLNDLDADRYPQTDTDEPWLDDVGVEALPLVSEFGFFADRDGGFPDGLPYEDDCPACAELRAANESATNIAHRVCAELWHPFFATNGIPEKTHLALHLWKTAYTNDIDAVLQRIDDNLASVTETLVTHWGTNVVRNTYRHPRGQQLDFPETATHTLQYGTADGLGAFVAAGILPDGDSPAFIPDLSLTADVTFGIDTNAAAITATTTSTTPQLHLLDSLLDGPIGSLLDGDWTLEYIVTTNEAAANPDETDDPIDSLPEYTTTFTFHPADATLLDDILAKFAETPEEEQEEEQENPEDTEQQEEQQDPNQQGDQQDAEQQGEQQDDPDQQEPGQSGEEETEEDTEEPVDPDDGDSGAEPPVVVLPVTFTATTNDFGETTAVLATTPSNETLDRLQPFISRLLRSDDASVSVVTNAPPEEEGGYASTVTRYELAVWYEVVKNGPETRHGSGGLLESSGAATLADESRVLVIDELDFVDRFACATNEVPFFFEAACVHSAFDTNGVLIASHTVTNLLPVGRSSITNVVYEQKPDSVAAYPSGDAFDWSVVSTDFSSSNIVADVLNTLHFSTQLYLEDDDPLDDDGRPYAPDVYPYDESPGVGSDAARNGESDASIEDSGAEPPSGEEGSETSAGGVGVEPPSPGAAPPWLLETARPLAIAVDDPRFNGHTYEWYDVDEPTPGDPPDRFPGEEDEENFFSVYPRFAGYPVLHHDGLPASIGDIGTLGIDKPWETLDLFASSGAKLLDLWCLHAPATNDDRRAFGRIHACTPFPGAAALLFADAVFGTNRLAAGAAAALGEAGNPGEGSGATTGDAEDEPPSFADAVREKDSVATEVLDLLTNAVCTVGWTFSPQPTNFLGNAETDAAGVSLGGLPTTTEGSETESLSVCIFPFAQWMDALAPHIEDLPETLGLPVDGSAGSEPPSFAGVEHIGLDLAEDLVRDLPDRVTFRQNLALAIVRSDSLAPNGRVFATSWQAVLLWRDAWTGRWTILEQQELR